MIVENEPYKFRIFDKTTNTYIIPDGYSPMRYIIDQNGGLMGLNMTTMAWLGTLSKSTYIIERFTQMQDKQNQDLYEGDIIENDHGVRFLIKFGEHNMYCPVDNTMMENIGFYTLAQTYDEYMPLGPTHEYAHKIGNINQNASLYEEGK